MDLTSFFSQLFTATGFVKILILIIILFLIVFTLVLLNQVRVMNRVITEKHSSSILIFIAIINTILTISLFFYTIFIL